MKTRCVVIGGGPAGMLAALSAAEGGGEVTLLEPNAKLGRKLYITGKGRCNLTNACPPEEVIRNLPRNGRFLYSALSQFPPSAVMDYVTQLGVPLKIERGGRVFPCSDKAADVVDGLFFALRRRGISIVQERALAIQTADYRVTGVRTDRGSISCQSVVLATGGRSYPLTGSTGDGYRLAAELGHTVIEPKPSLVPLVAEGDICQRMQGLSLRNVTLTVTNQKGKVLYQELGEMLFTHFGLSGPLILSASAHMRNFDKERYTVHIDLKPALEEQKLDARLLRDFGEQQNRAFHNVLEGLLPRLMVPVVVERAGIPADTQVNAITKQQRRQLLAVLKDFTLTILEPRPIDEAIVTSGGIKVSEIDPKTMMSKLVEGLFFAGEIIDVDGYTGGFNLQVAWCTGRAAGLSAGKEIWEDGSHAVSEHCH